jgi:hypothetical protein
MEARVLLVSLMAATAAGALARAAVRHPRPLGTRVSPYAAPARSRFGTVKPERTGPETGEGRTAIGLVFGPIVRRLANGLASLVDASSSTSAELRLRQAGMRMTVEQYRTRQLAYTAGALAAGAFLGLALGRRAGTVILLAAAAGIWGAPLVGAANWIGGSASAASGCEPSCTPCANSWRSTSAPGTPLPVLSTD